MSFCLALLGATQARADVIEIGDDGVVRQRSDTAAVAWVERNSDNQGSARSDLVASPPAPQDNVPLSAGAVPAAWRAPLEATAARYSVSPHLLAALVWQESRWQPQAVSPKGAIGLGQLMPATARALAVDPRDPQANLDGSARYLRELLDMFDGHLDRALAAYNAGATRVIRAGGIPRIAETRAYVANILDRIAATSDTGLQK